jgi:hypothetical protein
MWMRRSQRCTWWASAKVRSATAETRSARFCAASADDSHHSPFVLSLSRLNMSMNADSNAAFMQGGEHNNLFGSIDRNK